MNLGQAAHLSGQTAQMNPGSGHGMPQQQQLQVAPGPPGMDHEFISMRRTMLERIADIFKKTRGLTKTNQQLMHLVKQLEVFMYKKHPTKAGYYEMLKGSIEVHLAEAYKALKAIHQRQQMLTQVSSSSNNGTMIPTGDMAQSANGNSAMPYLMDTKATGHNSITGSMHNQYQNPSTSMPLDSTTSSVSVVTTSGSLQRQATHTIPTLGFSNQPTLLANSEYLSGVGCFNGKLNIMPQMQQEHKPFDNAQSCYPVQRLGGDAGSGVHSSMPDTSSYGSSDAKMNDGMGLRSNLHRTTPSEAFANPSPYGSSCNKSFHQQFNAFPPQKTSTSADMTIPISFYDTGSSAPTSNLATNDANFLSNSIMNAEFLTSQATTQSLQRQPQHCMKAELLDHKKIVNFSASQLSQEQLLRQQQLQHCHSQFVQNHYSFNCQQQNTQQHQFNRRGNSLEQCQLGSGHADQLLGHGDLSHSELMSSQVTKYANLKGQCQLTSSQDNDNRGQHFHIPALNSHGSQPLLSLHQKSVGGLSGAGCFVNGKYTEPLLQPHFKSQPIDKAHVTNCFSIEKQGQDYFCGTMAEDRGHQLVSSDSLIVGCAVTSSDPKLPKLLTRGYIQATRKMKDDLNQIRWLLMLKHAEACPAPVGSCKSQYCASVQEIVKHFRDCQTKRCAYRYCSQSKMLSGHYEKCIDEHCPVCSKVKERLRRSSEQAHKLTLDEPILTTQKNTIQQTTNGAHDDRMDIDLVVVHTFDEQPLAPKRLRLQPMSTNAPENKNPNVDVSEANPRFISQEQETKMVPKQEVNVMADMPPPEDPVIIGHGIDGKVGAMQNNVISGVQQANLLADKDMNKNVVDFKNKTNGRTMMAKSLKPKIKGVSLMELFTPEQIKEHADSLKQWVGQSKAKVGKSQAMEHSENENSCQLCKVVKLNFEPPPIYCSPCGVRIKRNALYYTVSTIETSHNFCMLCYNESRNHKIEVEGKLIDKDKLAKKRNDVETEESWVECGKCQSWQHQICALFNSKRNDVGEAEYICPKCYVWEIEHGLRIPLPQSAVLGAKDLPKTVLSDHIEERLFKRLREERHNRALRDGKSFDEVPGAAGLVVRVVSSVDKKLEVKPRFFEIFQEDKYPAEFPYKSKAILLFQKIEGVEVCLFGMYVQEFGAECAAPNQRRVYLSYLDSVKFFRPEVKTVSGEALRTYVYHEILIGYLEYCKQRGFTSCYIWACPPLKGEDYILYCHPEIQKTPRSDKLREWYLSMLRKAMKEHIVVELTNLYDHFFITTKECKAKVTASRLPYFDGDYWPGAAEDMINQLFLEENDSKLQKGKVKKAITKRALRAAGQTDLSGNASKDAILMQKLGETIYPMKEDFIMVHLQHSCSHCSILMVAGKRWVCHQCRSFNICDSCYDTDQQLEEKERHPNNSRDSHVLHPVEIAGVPGDTMDKDDILECEFFDTRQAFLSLCQGNRYQHDTLRRAKHSSMMVLYHLHNPTAPAFVTTCNICKNDIETGLGWRCEECTDFDVCAACYQKDGGANHPHKLTNHPSSTDRNAQNKEARQMRVQQARRMLDLLVHAHSCRAIPCLYPDCLRVKRLFKHAMICKIRAAKGCKVCQKMWSLLQLHARACKESKCSIPRCRDLKNHLRRLQQQSESRRRAAVDEMMRQRAAEVVRN
ncbi:probable histone acetyltransferase HAC-like 1 isoform X1 [Brachypodium distachyon]|uniref:histone acetyltransferase n=1 Tax=Brachypodium distachyon TaxID=15368 RepID=A0A0Q3RXM9_BRADI|nr:probable histone acetyltransferase HAC-like 1 isoform X1 [Brachypodium distachyon]KQK17450.1 hypothetical protein BRADI_1g34530v3 [Brachypodium distachyon]|eukprot:XP_014752973.1 probable histone acetyltransferase HAC-like 1 isoform X1 [Brachypodium distachyon]